MPKRRRLGAAAVALALTMVGCEVIALPPAPRPPRPPLLTVTDFTAPQGSVVWDLAFLPDMTMFFTLRNGAIRVRLPAGTINTIADPVDPDLRNTGGEGGLMGLAADPSFETNHFIYACYSWKDPGDLSPPFTTDNRVVRFTVNATFDGTTAITPIVIGLPHNDPANGRHSGCRPRFDPSTGTVDPALFITTGDAAQGTNPQNLSELGGKVLRVTRDGDPYPGNPFIGITGDDRIYTFGHRNVQGLAFRPSDSQPFSVEHGPGVDDEVHRLGLGSNLSLNNSGWNPVFNPPGLAYNEFVPMTDTRTGPPPLPLPRCCLAVPWKSGGSTVAPSGATFLSGSQWDAWNGALVLGLLKFDSSGKRLRILTLNAAGTAVLASTDALVDGERKRTVVQGPDGNLYVGTDSGRILKVVPS